jgi:hypothetical protein
MFMLSLRDGRQRARGEAKCVEVTSRTGNA